MIVVEPIAVTDGSFDDAESNVPENENPLFVLGTSYTVGQKVMETTGVHRNYECLIANNDQTPSEQTVDGNNDPYWLDLGATNRWAMFDTVINNQTTNSGSITFKLMPSQIIDTISLLNISGYEVQIVGTDPVDGEFYNETFDLISTDGIIDGYTYCFNGFSTVPDIVAEGIPPYGSGEFEITLLSEDNAKIGEFVYGTRYDIGEALVGAQPGIESFSSKGQNVFGGYELIKRGNRKLLDIDTIAITERIDDISQKMAKIIDKPCLWVGDVNRSSLIIYGFLSAYNPSFGVAGSYSYFNYEIEGLI